VIIGSVSEVGLVKEAALEARVRELDRLLARSSLRSTRVRRGRAPAPAIDCSPPRRGGQLYLHAVSARLRCSICGVRRVRLTITDSPLSLAPHDATNTAKWRVALVP
jgi:hypothetical protein